MRQLTALPSRQYETAYHLEEGFFHKLIVTLEQSNMGPPALSLAAAAIVDGLTALIAGPPVAAAVVVGQSADALILHRLARSGISFGPLKIQWLVLALGRTAVAALLSFGLRLLGVKPRTSSLDVWLGLAAQVAGMLLVLRGYHAEPARLNVGTIELAVPALKPGTAVRLLHVADVHVERYGVRERALVELARAAKPDAILFSGDFLNLSYVRDARALQDARQLWQTLCTLAPVYAVTGSPPVDPPDIVARLLSGLPVRWLRDESELLVLQRNRIRIVGLTCTHNPVADGDTLRRVMASTANAAGADAAFTVLLYHAPDLAPQASRLGSIDLHLAGHTHGGQVRLPGYGALVTASLYYKSLEMGLYQLADMLLFVSRGVGLEGKGAPRVRFNCPPEIKLFVLSGPERDKP